MNDDDLEHLLRQSNPFPTPAEESLNSRHRGILDSIVTGQHPVPPSSRRLTWLVAAPFAAVAVLVVAVLAIANPFAMAPAAAWGPAPLVYTTTSFNLEETMQQAIEKARATAAPATAERGAVSTSWNLRVNEAGTAQQVTEIVPSVADLTWAEDLSGRLVTSVGVPYAADASVHSTRAPADPQPGDIIDDRIYGPGEYPALVPDASALDGHGIETVLSVMVDPALPGDALPVVQGLLSEWTLTGAQQASLLETLAKYDNLRVLGATTDRLGREVIGVGAPASGNRKSSFFLSMTTGRVIGVEQSVLDADDALGVPAGTVISYTMWKDTQ